jgi:hypothetical protein
MTKSKNTLLGLMLVVGVVALSIPSRAQLPASPPVPSMAPSTMSSNPPSATSSTGNGIIDQVKAFITEPDTGFKTFDGKKADVWMGACFEQNVNADAIIGADYQVYQKVEIDGYARIWNSSQTIKSVGAGPAVELSLGDLKFGGGIDGTWRFDDDCFAVSPFLQAKKGVGANSYLMLRLQTDFEFSKTLDDQKPFLATAFGINF